jgi:hypothetical protein
METGCFICKEIGRRYTLHISDAAEFDTLDEAQHYVDNNMASETVLFLQVLA